MLSYCLLTSIVSDKESMFSYCCSPICTVLSFSDYIHIFLLSLVFSSLTLRCVSAVSFVFIYWVLAELVDFSANFKNFWTLYLQILFSGPLSFFSEASTTRILHDLPFSKGHWAVLNI